MMKTNKKPQIANINFTDLDDEINAVSNKYFKYWMHESLKGKDIDSSHIDYNNTKIVDDFRQGLFKSVEAFWQFMHKTPEEYCDKKKDLIVGAMCGYLDKTWNERYLEPLKTTSPKTPEMAFALCNYFKATNLTAFIGKNKSLFPRVKNKPIKKLKSAIKKNYFKTKYFLQYGQWPTWLR